MLREFRDFRQFLSGTHRINHQWYIAEFCTISGQWSPSRYCLDLFSNVYNSIESKVVSGYLFLNYWTKLRWVSYKTGEYKVRATFYHLVSFKHLSLGISVFMHPFWIPPGLTYSSHRQQVYQIWFQNVFVLSFKKAMGCWKSRNITWLHNRDEDMWCPWQSLCLEQQLDESPVYEILSVQ